MKMKQGLLVGMFRTMKVFAREIAAEHLSTLVDAKLLAIEFADERLIEPVKLLVVRTLVEAEDCYLGHTSLTTEGLDEMLLVVCKEQPTGRPIPVVPVDRDKAYQLGLDPSFKVYQRAVLPLHIGWSTGLGMPLWQTIKDTLVAIETLCTCRAPSETRRSEPPSAHAVN
ncbi:MAG: hypothetical protein ABIP96_00610 [Patescibacteria group bacterium]